MTTLIAYDGSGSTGGYNNRFYHAQTQHLVAQFPDAQLVLWDTSPRVVSREELAKINASCTGHGGTNTTAIAQHVKACNFHGRLVIITDGQVDNSCIDRCAAMLGPAWRFQHVDVHLIDTGGKVNMSVSCAFTRLAPHNVYCYNRQNDYKPVQQVAVSENDVDALRQIGTIVTVADYETHAAAIERVVVAQTMGTTGDPSLRDAILAMKKRIVSKQALASGKSESATALAAALNAGNVESALLLASQVHHEYYNEEPGWSASISRLVSMCEGALRSAFDVTAINSAIASDRLRRAGTVAPVAMPAVIEEAAVASFVCPITLDDAADVILLVADGAPVLEGLDKAVVTDILSCPLNLFHHADVVALLSKRLDHCVSLAAYGDAAAAGAGMCTSPMTRRPLLAGGICLGLSDQHCKATTWTIAQLVTGGKLVGNADLWFGCLWLMIRRHQTSQHLADVEPLFKANMVWRMQHHTTFASLTGLPEFVSTRVPLGVAVWYVFASSQFTSEPSRELVRTHMAHIDELLDIQHCSSFNVPADILEHVIRVRVMLHMLGWVKRNRRTLGETLLGLTQASLRLPGVADNVVDVALDVKSCEHVPARVPVDGAPSAEMVAEVRASLPAYWTRLSDAQLVGLAELVDPSKSASDIVLAIDWMPASMSAGRVEWAYGVGAIEKRLVEVCVATCRPFSTVKGEPWKTVAERVCGFGASEMISLNKQFAMFVTKYQRYPTKTELLVFVYNRYVFHGQHQTLPAQISQFIDEVFDEFRQVMELVTPAQFVHRFDASTHHDARAAMEAACK